jgi:predicted double-glycine peptidase
MKLRLTEQELIKFIKQVISETDAPPNLLHVPHYLQSDDSTCGPASLRMVMAYYGLELSEKDLADASGHSYESGCRSEDMASAAKNLGFDVYLKNNSTIEDLSRLVNAGAPVIVDWFCGDPPEGHSSVVIGVNDKNIYILDPYLEEMRVVPKEDFRRCWFDFYETPITPQNLYVGQIIVIRPHGTNIMEQTESESKRQRFNFQKLVDDGVLWITQPHVNGQRVKPNWEGDSNVITLWNIEHPEEGQEWVHNAIKYPKPEAINWWTEKGQDTLSDAKYRQILRSIKLVDSEVKNEFKEGELKERCWKGYTQKGMKTMFGRKYPNCVKIKK